jgi:hypothetical protein
MVKGTDCDCLCVGHDQCNDDGELRIHTVVLGIVD